MLTGIDKIREGSFILRDERQPLRERMKQGASTMQQGMLATHGWPEEFRIRADHLTQALHAEGTIGETIEKMDGQTVERRAQELIEFSDVLESSDANVAEGQQGTRPPA